MRIGRCGRYCIGWCLGLFPACFLIHFSRYLVINGWFWCIFWFAFSRRFRKSIMRLGRWWLLRICWVRFCLFWNNFLQFDALKVWIFWRSVRMIFSKFWDFTLYLWEDFRFVGSGAFGRTGLLEAWSVLRIIACCRNICLLFSVLFVYFIPFFNLIFFFKYLFKIFIFLN